MTIDEAIQHCEEIASSRCDICGAEHEQLAMWLKELKMQRGFADFMIDKCATLERKLQDMIRKSSKQKGRKIHDRRRRETACMCADADGILQIKETV